ncbi:hypothetical protein [Streptomyces sp. NBC_00470]|uniref:hypothetical protein n=1 Tax=Streptomyces sp. NBC_00470 TaxID=2975753 RepID=UPI0030E46A7C
MNATITTTDIIAWDILANGGLTWDTTGAAPTTGYMVSIAGSEVQIPVDEFSTADLDRFAEANAPLIRAGRYFGAWVEGDTVFLDISANVAERAEAVAMGYAEEQLAIFDVAAGEVVYM